MILFRRLSYAMNHLLLRLIVKQPPKTCGGDLHDELPSFTFRLIIYLFPFIL